MKIFISWSGERSRIIANGLNSWLPKVIQAIKPFYSPEIEKGVKGIEEINATLEGTSFGIICLTPDNIASPWIHYEAGALSKIEGARIWTLLYNLKHSDIVQPLAQFQHTLANKEDIYKLLDSINAKLPESLDKSVLKDSFERWWSDFEHTLKFAGKITNIQSNQDIENIRSDREILNEVLEILRKQQRIQEKTVPNSTQQLNEMLSSEELDSSKFLAIEFTLLFEEVNESDLRQTLVVFENFIQNKGYKYRISEHYSEPIIRVIFSPPEGLDIVNSIRYRAIELFGESNVLWRYIRSLNSPNISSLAA